MALVVFDECDVVDASFLRAVDLGQFGVFHDLDLAVFNLFVDAVNPVVLRAELLAAVGDVDGVGELREEGGFLHGGVAAADDEHVLPAEERAVTGRTRREPVAHQFVFAGDAERAGAGTRSGDDGVGGVDIAVREFDPEGATRVVDRFDDAVFSSAPNWRPVLSCC